MTELKIATAYVGLCSISEDSPEASVSLASFGSHEIRMVAALHLGVDRAPLFWLELFDHRAKTAIKSRGCHTLKDAVPAANDFLAQADHLNKPGETH